MMLQAALAYASAGVRVFPCHWPVEGGGCSCGNAGCKSPGKHPRVASWATAATGDAVRITGYWERNPLANIGMPTGPITGLSIFDIDPKGGGWESLRALEAQWGPRPATRKVRTGSGGEHDYYRHVPGLRNSTSKLGPGLDVRGEGGFVIVPPSLHASGLRYEWVNPTEPVVAAPEWLAGLAAPAAEAVREGRPVEEWTELFAAGASEPGRNDTVTRLTGYLIKRRLDPMMVYDIMKLWNKARCRPPLDEDELRKTVGSICRGILEKRRGRR